MNCGGDGQAEAKEYANKNNKEGERMIYLIREHTLKFSSSYFKFWEDQHSYLIKNTLYSL